MWAEGVGTGENFQYKAVSGDSSGRAGWGCEAVWAGWAEGFGHALEACKNFLCIYSSEWRQ